MVVAGPGGVLAGAEKLALATAVAGFAVLASQVHTGSSLAFTCFCGYHLLSPGDPVLEQASCNHFGMPVTVRVP